MDKSMVRELSGSQFIVNRSTFISTAYNEGTDELRKYALCQVDRASIIFPSIARKICHLACPSWSSSRASKSSVFLRKWRR